MPESDGVAHDIKHSVLPDNTLVELILELEDLARRDTHNILKAERADSVDDASKRQAATTATHRLAATANPVTYLATDPVTAMKPAPKFFDAQRLIKRFHNKVPLKSVPEILPWSCTCRIPWP